MHQEQDRQRRLARLRRADALAPQVELHVALVRPVFRAPDVGGPMPLPGCLRVRRRKARRQSGADAEARALDDGTACDRLIRHGVLPIRGCAGSGADRGHNVGRQRYQIAARVQADRVRPKGPWRLRLPPSRRAQTSASWSALARQRLRGEAVDLMHGKPRWSAGCSIRCARPRGSSTTGSAGTGSASRSASPSSPSPRWCSTASCATSTSTRWSMRSRRRDGAQLVLAGFSSRPAISR